MRPLLISSGEPAGIGPDICLALAGHELPLVVLGNKALFEERALQLGLACVIEEYQTGMSPVCAPNHLTILSRPLGAKVVPGELDARNVPYVLDLLSNAVAHCQSGEFSALVTAPIHKAVINQAGFPFTGHTEWLAEKTNAEQVVMMLVCDVMRMALVTTHLPLRQVPDAITSRLLYDVIMRVDQALKQDFAIKHPKLFVAGLNPHAGELGYMGREEIDVMLPVLQALAQQGVDVQGPLPADTLFTKQYTQEADAFIAMYHDQGLPVLKYAGFGDAVNVTLGLPFIRTSVDHGTALALAGSGKATNDSLNRALTLAANMANSRQIT